MDRVDVDRAPEITSFTRDAHAAGLKVHPYTVRRDALPKGITAETTLLKLLGDANVDGYFTDFP